MQRLPLKKISVAVRVVVHIPFEVYMFSSVLQKLCPRHKHKETAHILSGAPVHTLTGKCATV